MFQGWRFKLREAEQALEGGRLDEAGKLLAQGDLMQFLPGKKLAARLADQFCQRARQRVLNGDDTSGWRDLEAARDLTGETASWLSYRQELVELGMDEAESCLHAGDTPGALQRLEKLERRGGRDQTLLHAKEVARRMDSAAHLMSRGKFADAEAQLDAAARLRPDLPIISQRQAVCRQNHEQSRELMQRMHKALTAEDWSEAVTTADQLLELSPENRLARDARRRAWAQVGADIKDSRRLADTQVWQPATNRRRTMTMSISMAEGIPVEDPLGPRFLLWVDAVGGFLVCLSKEIILGQSAPGNSIHVPIQADLSRRHARICRRGEGYVIEPFQPVRIRGQRIDGITLLSDGDDIELGQGVRLRFRMPHALSASARLDFLSRHRSQPGADAILLMAESCVLGPNLQNHIVCRDWQNDVVLYRRDDELYCRTMEAIEIDGQLCDGGGRVGLRSRVDGSDFSMSLEEIT